MIKSTEAEIEESMRHEASTREPIQQSNTFCLAILFIALFTVVIWSILDFPW